MSEAKELKATPQLLDGRLVAWQCMSPAPLIRSAGTKRVWMDESPSQFAYRCLPMVISNSFGWDIINPTTFTAHWVGGVAPSDVKIHWPTSHPSYVPQAHFGAGVLTFSLGHLFQTSPGINLYVKGPPNVPKDGIVALEGIVETDWSPATFTMNWLFTRKNFPVTFEAGESYCRIFPIPRYVTENIDPEIWSIGSNPELQELHSLWRGTRDAFNKGLKVPDSEYTKKRWQKEYFQGGGTEVWGKFSDHQTRLHQKEFLDQRDPQFHEQDFPPDKKTRFVDVNFGGHIQRIYFPEESVEGDGACPYRDER